MAEPRPSTDEESAPLLQSNNHSPPAEPSFAERITAVVQEPLTALTKLLLVLALILLLLSSVFIGLFAGAQHKLNNRKDGDGDTKWPVTETYTTTATTTATKTSVVTTTALPPVPTSPPEPKACFSAECIKLSASILSSLDTSVDPCENFYEFANGGWLKDHPLPSDKGSFGAFNALAVENQYIIKGILESEDTPSLAPSYDEQILRKLRGLYGSCMNEDLLDDIGVRPLLHIVDTIRHLFRENSTVISSVDMGEASKSNATGLTAALAFLHSRGVPALFDFDIDGDVGVDPNQMTLWFSQSNFGLPSKEYYEEESIVDIYQGVVERLLKTLSDDSSVQETRASESSSSLVVHGDSDVKFWPPWPWPPWGGDDGDKEPAPIEISELARLVVEFEAKLANASLDLDLLYQDPIGTYNPLPIENVTSAIPQINFGDYFAAFTPRAFPSRVIVTYPAYTHALGDLLNSTDARAVEGYLVTRAALALAPHLGRGTEAWQAVRGLQETLQGIKKGAVGDRAEYCIGRVEGALGFAAGRYFSNITFGGDSREVGTKVITDIIGSFKESLKHLEWMDKKSADAAAAKADALRVKVGYPISPDTLDARSIASYYYLVKINNETFFENMLSARVSDQFKKWQKLGKQRDPEAWEMYPSMVNAYFNPPANEIVFPAGILRPPFFSQEWPAYLAYGGFGMVAAHELTHAFDSAGRLYNQEGKLEQWWTNATSEGFQVRQECIVNQYASYYVEDGKGGKVYVNGNLTSGENIGDSGLIQAYRAWKSQSFEDDSSNYVLPGLNFTQEQLFFISFGRVWAQNIKPAAAVQRVRTDPHSPNQFRVDGTLSNVPEFAKAFNCSAKAKLNPPQKDRCIFW